MKVIIIMALILLNITSVGFAKTSTPSKKSQKVEPSRNKNVKLGTSFRFDASSLNGKFQNSPSTTATIEDDKFIDDLLGARKNFNDRIEKNRDRN